jgi:hypothetical protein
MSMLVASTLYCDFGLSFDFVARDDNLRPAGRVEIGRYCTAALEVFGLPPTSREGRGPSFTFGFPAAGYDEEL